MPQNRLREIREKRGLSQAALAEKLNTTQVSVGRYEREDQRLDLVLMSRLTRILRCTIGQLAGETPLEDEPVNAPLDRARISAIIDALDHHLTEHKLKVLPGGRSDLVLAIYDWSLEQHIAVADIGDLSKIGPLLRPALSK